MVVWWLLCLLLLGRAQPPAQQPSVDKEVEEAKALYREANFTEAIVKLEAAIEHLKTVRDLDVKRTRLGDAYLHMALSYFALDNRTAAKEYLKGMLRLERMRRLDPQIYAPPILELLEEARADVLKEAPGMAEAALGLPPPPAKKKGGSKKPLIFLGLGGAAAAGVAAAASSGGGGGGGGEAQRTATISTFPAPPKLPIVGADITFNLNVMGPGGPGNLSWTWDFGDGATGTGMQVRHAYQSEGTFNVVATGRDDKGTLTARTTVTPRSVIGTWDGANDRGPRFVATFTSQSGPNLDGKLGDGTRFTAVVQGDGLNISARCFSGGFFNGRANDAVTMFTGTGALPCNAPNAGVTLTRRQ